MLIRLPVALSALRGPACAVAGPSRLSQPFHGTALRFDDDDAGFAGHVAELHRRKKRIEEKRRQKGGDFVDHMIVTVRGGKGGAGTSSFLPSRRGLGPPSGGNGGPGGSVYLQTSPHLTSLSSVGKRLIGGQGGNGAGNFRHGRRGADVVVTVPIGTVVREVRREGEADKVAADEAGLDPAECKARRRERWFVSHPTYGTDERDWREAEGFLRSSGRAGQRTPSFEEAPPVVLDIEAPVERHLLAAGGQGGHGNPYFTTPATRTPRLASRGVQPATHTYVFELKLLADVGLVGLPNAGKSTILRALTGRRAEVADYAFTTLNPQVGVVRVFDDGTWGGGLGVVEETERERARDEAARERGEYAPLARPDRRRGAERTRFTVSDNPGLLARAAENVGLGHSFLRSIERSLALAYVLDATRPHVADDLAVLRTELEAYLPGLAGRARAVVLNKADDVDDAADKADALCRALDELPEGKDVQVLVVSGKYGDGLESLVRVLASSVDEARERKGIPPPAQVREAVREVKAREKVEPVKREEQDDVEDLIA
ncbi:GTPase of the mitochondrial inner membrane that associates with the large ribosomal subunit [Cryptotrichosporon argae]